MANGEAKWQTRGYLSVDQSAVSSGRIARGGQAVDLSVLPLNEDRLLFKWDSMTERKSKARRDDTVRKLRIQTLAGQFAFNPPIAYRVPLIDCGVCQVKVRLIAKVQLNMILTDIIKFDFSYIKYCVLYQ